jgi:hypothetical protein
MLVLALELIELACEDGVGGEQFAQTKPNQSQTVCTGTARALGNSGSLTGIPGGIPGQTEQPNTANVIPSQFGVPNGPALAPYAGSP